MKTRPSPRTIYHLSVLTLLGLLAVPLALQSQSSGGSSSGSSGGSDSSSGETSGGTGTNQSGVPNQPGQPAQPGTPDQPGLPRQPGTPDQPGLPRQPGTPDQPGLPRQPGIPDQPGQPRQPGDPAPRFPNPPRDPAAEGVDRSRAGATSGAAPGQAPADRSGGTVPGTIDANGNIRPGVSADGTLRTDETGRDRTGLDPAITSQRLESSTFTTRDPALRLVERSSTAGAAYVGTIERGSANLTGDARIKVNTAIRRANEARTELDKSISLARSANERRWEKARAEVIERYNAYTKALQEAREAAIEGGARLDAQAGASTTGGM